MKNVTGVRRNGVLYGRRLCPRINHFPFFRAYPPSHCTRAMSVSTLYGIIFISYYYYNVTSNVAFMIYCHGHYAVRV